MVILGFGIGLAMSVLFGALVVMNPAVWTQPNRPHPTMLLLVLFGPAGGPFAEPLAFENYSVLGMSLWAIPLLLLVASHPMVPRVETGVASGLAIAFWFLLGLSYIYAGV